MNYEMLRAGVPPSVWTKMTRDQIEMFMDEKRDRAERNREIISKQTANKHADPLIRYVIPLES